MIQRFIGAILILIGSGIAGFTLSATHKKTAKAMQQLITALEFMEYELQYRQSPLPDILRRAAGKDGIIKHFLFTLSAELEGQISPNVECCVIAALEKCADMPKLVEDCLRKLGNCIGRFDLDRQVKGLRYVHEECVAVLTKYTKNDDVRLRSYQTLALCAGATLVICLL